MQTAFQHLSISVGHTQTQAYLPEYASRHPGRLAFIGQNWFMVLCFPPAFNAASPLKYSL